MGFTGVIWWICVGLLGDYMGLTRVILVFTGVILVGLLRFSVFYTVDYNGVYWGLYSGYVGFMGVSRSLVKLYVNGMAMFMMFSYICEDHVKVT